MDANLPVDPDAILAQAEAAAKAASAVLPSLEEQYDTKERELIALRLKIEQVRAVAAGHKAPQAVTNISPSSAKPLPRKMLAKPAVKPRPASIPFPTSAVPDVEWVLKNAGPISASDLIEKIKTDRHRVWGSSTIFNILKKGKDSHRYINDDGKWMLAESALKESA
jgi:hypothetical protein